MKDDNIVFGINSVKSVLTHTPHIVKEFFILDTLIKKKSDLVALAKKNNIYAQTISKQKLIKWLDNVNHQGVVLKIKQSQLLGEADFFKKFSFEHDGFKTANQPPQSQLFLILDEIQDTHNFGAILRTANAYGVAAVITTKDKSVSVNATVRKVSTGASEVTPIFQVNNLVRFLEKLKQKGVWIMGTVLDENSVSLSECDYNLPLGLVVGREGKGLRSRTIKNCDYLVHLPMTGIIESLNVSVATGICLFEITRRHKLLM